MREALMADRRQSASEDERPVRDQDKVMLRLPDGMRDRLKAFAAGNNRSMNAEIVARLETAEFGLRDRFAGQALIAVWGNPASMEVASNAGIGLASQTARWAYELADAMLAAREAR